MDLLEYQAKELFREVGIPVLPSQRIDNARDLKGLQIPYPVVIKSQVRAGGRGRAGGVRFAENTIDAIAAARTIFNLAILGEYPQVLLAEAKYNADREFYLAVVLDYAQRRPVLLGSPQGGINVEAVMEHLQQVVVDQEFSPFYARRLALKMGVKGELIASVSEIIEKMYHLFVQKDLELVEINPLGISPTGEVMALDGKITANDAALGRHPDLALVGAKKDTQQDQKSLSWSQAASASNDCKLNWLNREGNIGILCNGTGLMMATLDLLYEAGAKPANCLILGTNAEWDATPHPGIEQLELSLEQVSEAKGVKVVLVNILGGATFCEKVTGVIAAYLQRKAGRTLNGDDGRHIEDQKKRPPRRDRRLGFPSNIPQFVVRIIGGNSQTESVKEHSYGEASEREQLAAMPVHWEDNLDLAIAQTVSLAKSTKNL